MKLALQIEIRQHLVHHLGHPRRPLPRIRRSDLQPLGTHRIHPFFLLGGHRIIFRRIQGREPFSFDPATVGIRVFEEGDVGELPEDPVELGVVFLELRGRRFEFGGGEVGPVGFGVARFRGHPSKRSAVRTRPIADSCRNTT